MGVAEIDRALARAREQVRELRALRRAAEVAEHGSMTLKQAAAAMRISEAAALKRAQRGAGLKISGKWTFSALYVSGEAAKMSSLDRPVLSSTQDSLARS